MPWDRRVYNGRVVIPESRIVRLDLAYGGEVVDRGAAVYDFLRSTRKIILFDERENYPRPARRLSLA